MSRRRPPRRAVTEDRAASSQVDPTWHTWAIPCAIALVTFVAFLPTLSNDFVTWDDQVNFLENPHYRGLGIANLRWMWTTFLLGHYVPLSCMSLGLDYVLWGMN